MWPFKKKKEWRYKTVVIPVDWTPRAVKEHLESMYSDGWQQYGKDTVFETITIVFRKEAE
jgi:hypothetical protein